MDDDPDDVVRWKKPVLESIAEKPLPTLPEEVIVQILVCLPVRSLLQFRSVCNSWKHIISSPQFAQDHIQNSTADTTMTHQRLVTTSDVSNRRHYYLYDKFIFVPVQSVFEWTYTPVGTRTSLRMKGIFDILGSCNGLLCLHDIFHSYVRLWNPSTRLRSERSPVLLNNDPGGDYNITYCGFGHDHLHKYKVLIVVGKYGSTVTKVYTFGANSWTTIQDFPCRPNEAYPLDTIKFLGTFVSGTLNWLCRRDQRRIISFDLGNETYGEVSLPDRDDDNLSYPELGVLRNCLCWERRRIKKEKVVGRATEKSKLKLILEND